MIALAYYFTKISHVVLFWGAFILTRPLGATETDPFGGAAAVNIPVGSVTATAKVTATGQVVGINTGYVQQGRVSYLDIQPTPVN